MKDLMCAQIRNWHKSVLQIKMLNSQNLTRFLSSSYFVLLKFTFEVCLVKVQILPAAEFKERCVKR